MRLADREVQPRATFRHGNREYRGITIVDNFMGIVTLAFTVILLRRL